MPALAAGLLSLRRPHDATALRAIRTAANRSSRRPLGELQAMHSCAVAQSDRRQRACRCISPTDDCSICWRRDVLPGLGSLWGVASAVTSAIKQTTDEVVRSVQQTDWKTELAAFTHEVEAEAVKAVDVVQHLPKVVHARGSQVGLCLAGMQACMIVLRRRPAANTWYTWWQLHSWQPSAALGPACLCSARAATASAQLTHAQDGSTPRASGSAPGTPGASAAGALADPLTAMGASLAEFGMQLITGTKEVLETVRCDTASPGLAAAVRSC